MGSALDQVRPSAAGDMADILNQVDTMTLGDFQHALDDLMPKLNAAASAIAKSDTVCCSPVLSS